MGSWYWTYWPSVGPYWCVSVKPAERIPGQHGQAASCSPPSGLLLLPARDTPFAPGSPPTSPSHSYQPLALGDDSGRTTPDEGGRRWWQEKDNGLGGKEEENCHSYRVGKELLIMKTNFQQLFSWNTWLRRWVGRYICNSSVLYSLTLTKKKQKTKTCTTWSELMVSLPESTHWMLDILTVTTEQYWGLRPQSLGTCTRYLVKVCESRLRTKVSITAVVFHYQESMLIIQINFSVWFLVIYF